MSDERGTRVYVGNLGEKVKKEDLEGEFTKYGKLNSVWVAFNPPGFAFVEFENRNEAEKACDILNGTEVLGSKLRVEISKGRPKGRRDSGPRIGGGGGVGAGGGGGGGGRFGNNNGAPMRRDGPGGFRPGGRTDFRSSSGGSGSYRNDGNGNGFRPRPRTGFGGPSAGNGGGGGYGSNGNERAFGSRERSFGSGGGGGGGGGGGFNNRGNGNGGRFRSRSPVGRSRF